MTTTQSTIDNPHYVTREEANSKQCPLGMPYDKNCWCVGPDCMAWRWSDNAPMHYKGDGNPKPTDRAKGYCGMVRS
jgi:hypothetical protein